MQVGATILVGSPVLHVYLDASAELTTAHVTSAATRLLGSLAYAAVRHQAVKVIPDHDALASISTTPTPNDQTDGDAHATE